MRQGKASVLHKECGTGSQAAQEGQHTHTFLLARDKGTAARGRVRKEWHSEREARQGISEEIWYAHVNKGSLPGSMWAPCSSSSTSTLSQLEEVRQEICMTSLTFLAF